MSEPGPKEFDDLEPLPAPEEGGHETLDELEPLDELEELEPLPAKDEPAAREDAREPKPPTERPDRSAAQDAPVARPSEPTPEAAAGRSAARADALGSDSPREERIASTAPKASDRSEGSSAPESSASKGSASRSAADGVAEAAGETALPDASKAGPQTSGGVGGVNEAAAAAASASSAPKPSGDEQATETEDRGGAATPEDGKSRKTQGERDREKAERAAQKKAELDARLGKIEGKRELEQAPLVLRKASILLLAASMLPFGGALTLGSFVGKLLLLAAGWIFHQGHVFKAGEKASGLVASLAKKGMIPVFVTAGVLALAGFAMPSLVGGEAPFSIYGEFAALALACFTYTHIFDYEHGGKFNPIYPLMFLAPAIMGVLGILKLGEASGLVLVAAGLGSIGITVAGSMAVYTMFVAIKQAKIEGEKKKQAQAEARKAAREARRKQQDRA